ncbi:hypothetical protein CSAL01_05248 [Colletotrichum salicis]|uniref:Uncharacterized protein n=1 Tax=Colletotrichum salicis TaxID=1209931 RepID=A0A135ULZ9_9PEZI|nr:hypothetical protein CSAL01_05248 [Colletotrichum salicis]
MQGLILDEGQSEDMFWSLGTAWQFEAFPKDDRYLYQLDSAPHGTLRPPNAVYLPDPTLQSHHFTSLGHFPETTPLGP